MGKYRDNVSKKGNGAQERCHHRGQLAGVAFACISGIPLIVGLLCFDDWSSFFSEELLAWLIRLTLFTLLHCGTQVQSKHSAKPQLHSAKDLPSATPGNCCDGEVGFAECLFSNTRQSFVVCQNAIGKIK